MSGTYERIYAVVRKIPKGMVATYGQVAGLAGLAGHARQVGYALHSLPDHLDVPWQRVINAKGEISARSAESFGGFEDQQRSLLEREGIVFDRTGRISLPRFQWKPGGRGG